ncbi:MAG TPA: hypothetical protein VK395_03465 [Gemmataceae bacterium]|nr:hypothetical protein [Gemmataceae bacterium]
MAERRYYLRVRDEVTGPFRIEQLQLFRIRGQLQPHHEVSEDTITWEQASSVEELYNSAAAEPSDVIEIIPCELGRPSGLLAPEPNGEPRADSALLAGVPVESTESQALPAKSSVIPGRPTLRNWRRRLPAIFLAAGGVLGLCGIFSFAGSVSLKDKSQEELSGLRRELTTKEKELSQREQDLDFKQHAANQREARLVRLQQELDDKQQVLGSMEKKISESQQAIKKDERGLAQRENAVRARERALEENEKLLTKRQQDLDKVKQDSTGRRDK